MYFARRTAISKSTVVVLLSLLFFLTATNRVRADDDSASASSSSQRPSPSKTLRNIDPDATLTSAPSSSESLPLPEHLTRLTASTFDEFVSDPESISVVIFYASWHSRSVALFNELEKVAIQMREEGNTMIQFAALHGPHWKPLCRRIGVHSFPTVRVYVRGPNQPHTYTGFTFLAAELATYIEKIAAEDKRRAVVRREMDAHRAANPPPLVNALPGAVLELDPDEFNKYRNSTNILLFMMFYAPWCNSCKESFNDLMSTAEYFKTDETVVIGKLDCDTYALYCTETLNLEGYPTFITYQKPKMAKNGTVYTGERHTFDFRAHLDVQNMFWEIEGMDEVRAQFEKVRGMGKPPEDLSELGGMFANMPNKKMDDHLKKPQPIGNTRKMRKRRNEG